MVSEQVKPDNVTYFTIIQGCLILDRQSFALDLLKEALDMPALKQCQASNSQFTQQQKNTLNQMIYNLMFDENNQTAVKRYSDLVYIMNKLGFQACSVSAGSDKENEPAQASAFKLSSQPFVPKTGPNESSVRSPLVDLHALPQSLQSEQNNTCWAVS